MKSATELVTQWHKEWLDTLRDEPHWGDRIDWTTADNIAHRLDEVLNPPAPPQSCNRVSGALYCTLDKGHEGVCRPVPTED
jgi:hypothetical protein